MQAPDQNEMLDRLRLIEEMLAEGRRSTQRWGWTFLLWGIGPLIAMWWSDVGPRREWAWPVMMGLCVILNGLAIRARKRRGHSKTAAARSLGAVWTCAGVTVILFSVAAVWSGAIESPAVYAALFALAAVAHGTSSLILRWWPQFLAAMVWWIASVLAFVVPAARLETVAAVGLVLANVIFGAWLTYCERSRKDG